MCDKKYIIIPQLESWSDVVIVDPLYDGVLNKAYDPTDMTDAAKEKVTKETKETPGIEIRFPINDKTR